MTKNADEKVKSIKAILDGIEEVEMTTAEHQIWQIVNDLKKREPPSQCAENSQKLI